MERKIKVKRNKKGPKGGRRMDQFTIQSKRWGLTNPLENYTVTVPRGLYGIPPRMKTQLLYHAEYSFQSTPETNQVWRANSLFDPDLTGSGHQPRYFDTIKEMYTKYIVLACTVKLELVSLSSTGAKCVLVMSDTDVSAQNTLNLCELNFAKAITLGSVNGNGIGTLKSYASISTLMGQPILDPDDSMYALISANPSDPAFATFGAQTPGGSANLNLFIEAWIEYDCIFKDPTDPGSS